MKKSLTLLILLVGAFCIASLSAQNINYESNITQFYGGTCGNDPGFSTTEEHTWKGWIRDNINTSETYSGCVILNDNSPSTQTGTYANRIQNNISATQIIGRIDAWEDDSGNRCDYNTGLFVNEDDCRVEQTCTYNLTNPLEYQWTVASNTCGNGDYSMNLYYRYQYATTTIPNAVDNATVNYNTGGNRPFWGSIGNWAFFGNNCATSATITHNQTSSFSTTVSCKRQVSFRWRVDSEVNFDFLRVYINGVLQQQISGNTSWALVTLDLDYGQNTIEWRYFKDGSSSIGLDRGFVDQISFTNANNIEPGIVSGDQEICSGGNPVAFTSDDDAQSYGTSFNYQWQYSINGVTGWTNIGGATSTNYDPPAGLTSTRYYRRRVQDNCGLTDYSNTLSVTTNPLPNGLFTGTTSICEGNSANISFNATAGSGPWDITYNGVTLNNLNSGGNIPVNPTETTTYALTQVIDDNGCSRTTGFVGSATITVNTSSSAPGIDPVAAFQCPNDDILLSASGGVEGTGSAIEWYTGPNGTGSNLGSGNMITVNPTENTNYYARREGTCNTTPDASVLVDVRDFVYTGAGGTSSSSYCTDKDGWHHFYNASQDVIFSIEGDLSGATASPLVTIQNNGSIFQDADGAIGSCTDGLTPGTELFEMQRSWNVDFTGTLIPPYSIRFYYPQVERTTVQAAASIHMANNPDCGYTFTYPEPNGFYWFKNEGSDYLAPMYDQPTKLTATVSNINGFNYAEMTGITSFSGGSGGISLSPDPGLVLPVELVAFTGWNEVKQNLLQWITVSESNNSHFIVQHSANPIDGYEDLNRLEGMGTTSETTTYNYTHESPVAGDNYYRLKQVDFDGSINYSNVIVVRVDKTNNNHLFFPNPTDENLNHHFVSDKEEELKIEVVNLLGQQMDVSIFNTQRGLNTHTIDMADFPSGIYFVNVYTTTGRLVTSAKITKQDL